MNKFIIDGFGLLFKSHHAFIDLRTKDGKFSGSIYGFLTAIKALKKRYPDFHFIVAWDNEATRKKAAYIDYKANRPRFDMGEIIRDLKKIFSFTNVSQIEMVGEEADDVIASFVQDNLNKEGFIYVYSADKDLLQLVKDGKVIVIKPKSGQYPEMFFDEGGVKNLYGIKVEDFASFLAFRGDSVDNIPGVPRVRSKKIVYLINKYKNPRQIYSSLKSEKLTDFERKSFLNSESQVYTNYEIVNLVRNLGYSQQEGKSDKNSFQFILDKYEIRKVKSEEFVGLFENESSFLNKTGPVVESLSLF